MGSRGGARSRRGGRIALLGAGDYAAYDRHCVEAKSDARNAGAVFRHRRGELPGSILDLAYTDAAALYDAPEPTWVAAPLVEWRHTENGSAREGAPPQGLPASETSSPELTG